MAHHPGKGRARAFAWGFRRPGLACAGGVAVALSLPPWGWWWLAVLGLALAYVSLDEATVPRALGCGVAFGFGQLSIGLWWVNGFSVPGYVVLTLVSTLYSGLAFPLVARTARGAAFRIVTFPCALVLAEAARDRFPLGGLPLGGLPLGQMDGPFAGVARVAGALGILWACGLAGAVIGEAATCVAVMWARPRVRAHVARLAGTLALGAAAAGGIVVAGVLSPDGGPAIRHVAVAGVQGGGRRGLHAVTQGDPARVYALQVQETAKLAGAVLRPVPHGEHGSAGAHLAHGSAGAHLALVLWPEDVVALNGPLAGSPQQAQLAGIARRLRTTLVAGVTIPVGATGFLNEAVAWSPAGTEVGAFDKVHRVPFGEYIPWRGFFAHFGEVGLVPRDAIAGHGPGLLVTPAGRLGVMISFEVFYADRAAAAVHAGATLLVVPTNTASYTSSQVPGQEIAAARLRAIETGRDLVQAAPTGYSALVDDRGRVLARSGLGGAANVTGTLAMRGGWTVYDHTGDWPVVGLSVLACIGWWGDRLVRRQGGRAARRIGRRRGGQS